MSIHEVARAQLGEDGYRRFIDRYEQKERQVWVAWILWLLLGGLGAHKYYLGNIKWGIIYTFTLGLLTLGVWYDLFTLGRQIAAANERIGQELLRQESPGTSVTA